MWADALFALLGQMLLGVLVLGFLVQLFRRGNLLVNSFVTIATAALVVVVFAGWNAEAVKLYMIVGSSVMFATTAWPLAFLGTVTGWFSRRYLDRLLQERKTDE